MDIMIGSCNGLACFSKSNKDVQSVPFLVCNPLTGESILLPYNKLKYYTRTRITCGRLASGFGYCPLTDDYKFVTIYYCHEERKGHVHVYTVGGHEWRFIGFVGYHRFEHSTGIYANGTLYWLHQRDHDEVVAFDLEGEKFRSIPMPRYENFENKNGFLRFRRKLLGGNNNLYLAHMYHHAGSADIWVYKEHDINADDASYAMKKVQSETKRPQRKFVMLDERVQYTG
ncbi:F-box/kelch-repeat protein At3g06240-like [Papaver somniferum]|uniref:F-box/kelch-repeat protein At3g06240-like n=1 Tax=Papaver somniferum TaxID=3469 RepID=UPI000E6FA76C|nr:F-box/kelch-repeat protein At3g06240-like [Papaver somniferum]